MRASGMDEVLVGAGHVPAPPEVAGEVAAWLGDDPDAVRYAGQMVSSRKLCKELSLVPGWPPAAPHRKRGPGRGNPIGLGKGIRPEAATSAAQAPSTASAALRGHDR